MDIDKLLREKRKMERIVASAIYDFELATEFKARVEFVCVEHMAPEGTKEELLLATANVVLPDFIRIDTVREVRRGVTGAVSHDPSVGGGGGGVLMSTHPGDPGCSGGEFRHAIGKHIDEVDPRPRVEHHPIGKGFTGG